MFELFVVHVRCLCIVGVVNALRICVFDVHLVYLMCMCSVCCVCCVYGVRVRVCVA